MTLIENGAFRTGVHDRWSAKQAGRGSTGHALPAPNPDGAFPLNVFLEPGDESLEDMIAATRRGVLVTRFHYSNVVNPVESSITGMTRDGTFLIEDGEVKHPVKKLPIHPVDPGGVLRDLDDREGDGDRERILLLRLARAGAEDRPVRVHRQERSLVVG